MIRTVRHADFPLAELLAAKRRSVTVVLPARECAETVGAVVERIASLEGLVDQILVVDAASEDGTANAATEAGAEVVQQDALMAGHGPTLGKGDALWRALTACRGDVVAFVDADTRDFSGGFVNGLVGPLLTDPTVGFVKGTYQRPFMAGGQELPGGGGRVSQLTARPLLAAFYPDLEPLTQPLAGEVAAPRELLERIPFATGYAVEMAMLLEVREQLGAEAIVQCDLGERRNHHQPLGALRPMAEVVLATVSRRLAAEGRLAAQPPGPEIVERPPLTTVAV